MNNTSRFFLLLLLIWFCSDQLIQFHSVLFRLIFLSPSLSHTSIYLYTLSPSTFLHFCRKLMFISLFVRVVCSVCSSLVYCFVFFPLFGLYRLFRLLILIFYFFSSFVSLYVRLHTQCMCVCLCFLLSEMAARIRTTVITNLYPIFEEPQMYWKKEMAMRCITL